jgi:hypothetical protein
LFPEVGSGGNPFDADRAFPSEQDRAGAFAQDRAVPSPWPASVARSPLAVISTGCFSVPTCPNAHEQAQKRPKTGKSSLRIAGCEATEGGRRCKGKTPHSSIVRPLARQPERQRSRRLCLPGYFRSIKRSRMS